MISSSNGVWTEDRTTGTPRPPSSDLSFYAACLAITFHFGEHLRPQTCCMPFYPLITVPNRFNLSSGRSQGSHWVNFSRPCSWHSEIRTTWSLIVPAPWSRLAVSCQALPKAFSRPWATLFCSLPRPPLRWLWCVHISRLLRPSLIHHIDRQSL